ncbi:hypothetical protein Taro_033435, partial [Colocasia esculenta]|nr:hypothetical protein [Colocasia esculenta]
NSKIIEVNEWAHEEMFGMGRVAVRKVTRKGIAAFSIFWIPPIKLELGSRASRTQCYLRRSLVAVYVRWQSVGEERPHSSSIHGLHRAAPPGRHPAPTCRATDGNYSNRCAQPVGVCYGWLGNNLPSAWEVVGMYRSHNIRRMRIYYPGQQILQALRGSNIDLLLDFPGPLRDLAQSPAAASDWVRDNVLAYWPDVRFRYIAVGNEVIFDKGVAQYILPAMRNIYQALAAAGLRDQIKVSTSVQYGVMGESYPPSIGEFSSQVWPVMGPIVEFLRSTGAPLLVNVYPYFSHAGDPQNVDLDYAQFTAPDIVVVDGYNGLEYQNLFDAMVDAVYAALDRVGAGSVDVVVSETGWPSAGGFAATVENARIYNTNLVPHVGKGTPRKPGKAVEAYIFAMFNENQKQPPGIENNWGLFYPNKTPVYPITFAASSMATINSTEQRREGLDLAM